MHSDEILALAMKMAGIEKQPRDTMIYVPGEMKRILFGIDIDLADVMLAKQLGYDGVIGHHPIGMETRTHFHEVLDRQLDLMKETGATYDEARKALGKRQRELAFREMGVNYDRNVTAFRMFGLPVMNLHIVLDIITEKAVRDKVYPKFPEGNDKTIGELVDTLMEFDEFQKSPVKPRIMIGEPDDPCGLPMIALANGTFGGPDVVRVYWNHGRDTAVYMHIPDGDLKDLREDENRKNLVITGHMPTDSIGINIFIDALIGKGMQVDAFNGVVR
jgi:hypothetical protein